MGGVFGGGTISTSDTRINSMRVQTSAYGLPQYLVYGKNRIAANMFWYGDFKAIAHTTTQKAGGKGGGVKTKNTTYTYSASIMLGLCANKVRKIGLVWKDKEQIIAKTESGITQEPIDQLNFEFFNGDHNAAWGYLQTYHPDQALNYPFTAYVAASNYDMGDSASLSNHNFEVVSEITFSDSIHDANPADVIEDFMQNPRYGAAPNINIDDLTEFRSYCTAANLLISPAITEQRPAYEIINEIVEAVNCAVVPSVDGLKIKSYGDAVLSNHGVTYTPDLTAVAHLTDDDFMDEDEPVRVKRSRDTDAYNHVQIEYINRNNQYNTETVEAKDQANIEMYGLRTEDSVKYDFFCEPKIARHAAQLRLQRQLYVRNQYEFRLGWNHCLLEPMDIVTLTDPSLGLNQFPVRILEIEEDEDGYLNITAEELAIGTRSAIEYDLQSANGYQGGSEEPGDVYAPVIFEPPLDLTNGENQVYVAVAGGLNWGGCNVWASYDNQTYEAIGTIYGSARYGNLVQAITATDTALQVQLNTTNNQMYSGTQVDAAADATLFKIGNEYANYVDATLLGSGLYQLSGVIRGRYADPLAHAAGEHFVRLDRAIFTYQMNRSLIGKTIYLKFTSFNGLQAKEQTLDEVAAYSYTLNGGQPSGVAGLSLQSAFVGTSFKVQWQQVSGAAKYIVQIWANGQKLREVETTNTDYSYSLEEAETDGIWRAYTIRVASVANAQTSTFAELNISNPIPTMLDNIYVAATGDSISINWGASTAPDLKDYQVWLSTTSGFNPETILASWTGTTTSHTFTGLQSTTNYYLRVCARDKWRETSWNYSNQISVTTSE
ncbi:phage tail protein [Acinetobacter populi]|uniref:Fibronectin type-III domain-containing protein n=1 Tax=Acinetobacter populi TaxID=1582270 RepID=A0A1Z9YXR0_9GAMM|nr:phage tail protein [Acinetobacter populi]OUY06994.1 hypothetical protein CAP51_09875 [Acinetobacter populi]